MTRTHLVLPDSHAHPEYNNLRADLAGRLIADIKPDVVVNIGDMFDMPSLAGFDKGKASFYSQNYERDIEAGLDFDDRLWYKVRQAKKKKPRSVFIIGNHEQRLEKVLQQEFHLKGSKYGISFSDYGLDKNYQDVVEYDGSIPGVIEIDGVHYSHFFSSGLMGRPIGGEHQAYSMLSKNHTTCVCGHSHILDFSAKATRQGKMIYGLSAGVFQDYEAPWAGDVNRLWWRGLCILHNVNNGQFDLETVSIERLKEVYDD